MHPSSTARVSQLLDRIRNAGAKPCHEARMLRSWTQVLPFEAERFPKQVREEWLSLGKEIDSLARIQSEHPAAEGVARLLVKLCDGQMVESVLLPRGGLCVSTQVGCAVGCAFCMSGRDGLMRHLGSAEIVAQVALARSRREVKKVVFMGMGEPAHNLDNVMEAIETLGLHGNIGYKNLVLSTVGDLRVFERLPEMAVRPALAVSLHTTKMDLREKLLPRAPKIPVKELVERSEEYARHTHYPIQYQWTLLEGINDGEEEMENIATLLSGKYAVLNFIPFNRVDGLEFRRPTRERIAKILSHLNGKGILARMRDSAGQEVEGACGQLRARTLP